MYSVFFKMSEIITNVLFGIAERAFLKEKRGFREEYRLTIAPLQGWALTQTADRYFAEYRGNRLKFRPRFAILTESESLKGLPLVTGKREPERVYVSWKEVASDDFFRDVEELFKMVSRREGKRVAPSTSKGG